MGVSDSMPGRNSFILNPQRSDRGRSCGLLRGIRILMNNSTTSGLGVETSIDTLTVTGCVFMISVREFGFANVVLTESRNGAKDGFMNS